jgi:hypothetical protein
MRKLVVCPKCSGKFVPPPEPPFFPCPNCREEELTARFADCLAFRQHTVRTVITGPTRLVTRYSVFCGTRYMGPVIGTVVKVRRLYPIRRCRTPKQAVRFKYSPHYPRARPITESGVAEYQPYEMGMKRRWVYMWEVGKWNFR